MPAKEIYEIYDSHAHYDDDAFAGDRAWLLEHELPLGGVRCVINMGTRIRSCAASMGLADLNPYFFAAVGIHPEEIDDSLPENWLDCLRVWLEGGAVAVGEIGLDYHWKDTAPRDRQIQVFTAQLELANQMGFPVCVHDRDAHSDVLELLRLYRPQGVVHCFSGSVEMARAIVDLGMYIGIGGAVTFKNARKITEVARAIPLDRLLLETDAPYMAPDPHRGTRNDSTYIPLIAEKIAQLRGETTRSILEAANGNLRRLFRLDNIPQHIAPVTHIY
ncbi:TatD family hydrolase [Acutalibacter caecimuris]|uniref:TatD family hydrolase n=1 Tax=Acutalibacter caecimuris TaxID=3093657 RepID=UPI002AC901EC|nr:TatD family hydrolase [Acutalibacter sp. M00118]